MSKPAKTLRAIIDLTRLVRLKREYPDGPIPPTRFDFSPYNGHSVAFYDYNADDIEQLLNAHQRLVDGISEISDADGILSSKEMAKLAKDTMKKAGVR